MSETQSTPEHDGAVLSPDEVFSILSDDTRLGIVRALWRADAMRTFDDVDETAVTLPYSDLRERVGIEDNGKFNYHLSKLRPYFVRKSGAGYRLSGAGKRIARTVVAVSGPHSGVRQEVDVDCPLCGGTVDGSYEDAWLRFTCTECAGLFGDTAPDGTLLNENFPPAGVSPDDVATAYRAKLYRCVLDMLYLMQGICRECASPIRTSVTVCTDHAAGSDPCAACGHHSEAWATLQCPTCRFAKRLPVEFCTLGLLPTLSFLYEHGINLFDPSLEQLVGVVETRFELAVRDDPRRFDVTVGFADETLSLTLDEDLALVGQ